MRAFDFLQLLNENMSNGTFKIIDISWRCLKFFIDFINNLIIKFLNSK